MSEKLSQVESQTNSDHENNETNVEKSGSDSTSHNKPNPSKLQHGSSIGSSPFEKKPSPDKFQPLHGNKLLDLKKRDGLHKKMFQKSMFPTTTTLASPTDSLMSPVSQKLNSHKSRLYAKAKPTSLKFDKFKGDIAKDDPMDIDKEEEKENVSVPRFGRFGH